MNLPRAKTRGRWPTLPDYDDLGSLSRVRLWPFRLAVAERYRCRPVCGGCGENAYAAGTGDFHYWRKETNAVCERVPFDLCYDCLIAARSGSAEADYLRRALRILGRWTGAAMRASRVHRLGVNPEAKP